jgi:hypothetical protein
MPSKELEFHKELTVLFIIPFKSLFTAFLIRQQGPQQGKCFRKATPPVVFLRIDKDKERDMDIQGLQGHGSRTCTSFRLIPQKTKIDVEAPRLPSMAYLHTEREHLCDPIAAVDVTLLQFVSSFFERSFTLTVASTWVASCVLSQRIRGWKNYFVRPESKNTGMEDIFLAIPS